jgi:hypothetical protein
MQIRYKAADWLDVLDGEPGGENGDAPEVLARAEVVSELWDYLLRIGDTAHASARGDGQVPDDLEGSWYWAVLLLMVMTMAGATVFGIAMNIL